MFIVALKTIKSMMMIGDEMMIKTCLLIGTCLPTHRLVGLFMRAFFYGIFHSIIVFLYFLNYSLNNLKYLVKYRILLPQSTDTGWVVFCFLTQASKRQLCSQLGVEH